jgi:hypothetical protein
MGLLQITAGILGRTLITSINTAIPHEASLEHLLVLYP